MRAKGRRVFINGRLPIRQGWGRVIRQTEIARSGASPVAFKRIACVGLADRAEFRIDEFGGGGAVFAQRPGHMELQVAEGAQAFQKKSASKPAAAVLRQDAGPAKQVVFCIGIGAEGGGGNDAGTVLYSQCRVVLRAERLVNALVKRAGDRTVAARPLRIRGKRAFDQGEDRGFVRSRGRAYDQSVGQGHRLVVEQRQIPTKQLP